MMMKRYILPLFLLVFVLASCDGFGKDADIKKAKDEAILSIDEAKNNAIQSAKTEISAIVSNTMQDAKQDFSKTINSAKADVDATIKEKQEDANNQILEAKRLTAIVGVLAIVAILVCFGLIIAVRKSNRNFRDNVIKIVTDSSRINELLKQNKNNITSKTTYGDKDFNAAVIRCLKLPEYKGYLIDLIKTSSTAQKEVSSLHATDAKPETKVELFARDSSTKTLSGVNISFQQGKSIYKLQLANQDDRYADITLVDQDDVKRRILKSNEDLLSPVCVVERKSSEPQIVTVVKPGRVEKKGQDVWEVTTPISVELS